jgi:hypothetical protein
MVTNFISQFFTLLHIFWSPSVTVPAMPRGPPLHRLEAPRWLQRAQPRHRGGARQGAARCRKAQHCPLVSSVPQPQGGSRCPVIQGAGQSANADGTVVVVAVHARQRRARARRDEVPILKRTYDVRGSTTWRCACKITLIPFSQLKQILIKFCCGSHQIGTS